MGKNSVPRTTALALVHMLATYTNAESLQLVNDDEGASKYGLTSEQMGSLLQGYYSISSSEGKPIAPITISRLIDEINSWYKTIDGNSAVKGKFSLRLGIRTIEKYKIKKKDYYAASLLRGTGADLARNLDILWTLHAALEGNYFVEVQYRGDKTKKIYLPLCIQFRDDRYYLAAVQEKNLKEIDQREAAEPRIFRVDRIESASFVFDENPTDDQADSFDRVKCFGGRLEGWKKRADELMKNGVDNLFSGKAVQVKIQCHNEKALNRAEEVFKGHAGYELDRNAGTVKFEASRDGIKHWARKMSDIAEVKEPEDLRNEVIDDLMNSTYFKQGQWSVESMVKERVSKGLLLLRDCIINCRCVGVQTPLNGRPKLYLPLCIWFDGDKYHFIAEARGKAGEPSRGEQGKQPSSLDGFCLNETRLFYAVKGSDGKPRLVGHRPNSETAYSVPKEEFGELRKRLLEELREGSENNRWCPGGTVEVTVDCKDESNAERCGILAFQLSPNATSYAFEAAPEGIMRWARKWIDIAEITDPVELREKVADSLSKNPYAESVVAE